MLEPTGCNAHSAHIVQIVHAVASICWVSGSVHNPACLSPSLLAYMEQSTQAGCPHGVLHRCACVAWARTETVWPGLASTTHICSFSDAGLHQSGTCCACKVNLASMCVQGQLSKHNASGCGRPMVATPHAWEHTVCSGFFAGWLPCMVLPRNATTICT
jgi:hypothetical protein